MGTINGHGLSGVEAAFGDLLAQPAPVAFDARAIEGMPAPMLALEELRELLVGHRLDTHTTDAVWRQLALAARQWHQPWRLVAVAMAVPALSGMAAALRRRSPRHGEDVEAELMVGFLHAVLHADISPPRLWLRLCWAAWRAGEAVLPEQEDDELPPHLASGSHSPSRPYGHPDLVLGRAAAAGIITADEAELIGATRLGYELIEVLAAQQGLSAPVLRMRRRRAELTVEAAIAAGDLSGIAFAATYAKFRYEKAQQNSGSRVARRLSP